MQLPSSVANWPIVRPNLGRFWTKRTEKGPNFNKTVFLLLSFLILGSIQAIMLFPLTQTKLVFFLSPNSFKKGKLLGAEFFPSAVKCFFWIGWKVLQGVGNTASKFPEKPLALLRALKSIWYISIVFMTVIAKSSVADPGCLSRIRNPDFYSSRIPDTGSRISDPESNNSTKQGGGKNFFLSYPFL